MKKFLIYIFFSIFYFLIFIFSYAKQVEVEFHFDIDSGLIYYSNADIDSIGNLTTINFNKKNIKLSLKDGIYLFGFYDGKDRYLFKKFYITNDRNFKISFIPKKSIFIEGNILENDTPVENIKITFVDSMGREYSTTSLSDGKYSLNLPPENYFLMSSQFGYEILSENNSFNFSKPDMSYKIPISIKKSTGKIKGKVLSDNGHPVPEAEILVSNGKESKMIFSDKNGNFTIFLKEGLTSMKISKDGYDSRGFIRNFSRKDTVSLKTFTLNKKTYFISGTVTNDILPIREFEIYLFSQNGSLLDKVTTNENGNFKFLNIRNQDVYIYIPESELYEEYKSPIFFMEKNFSNKVISLNKK